MAEQNHGHLGLVPNPRLDQVLHHLATHHRGPQTLRLGPSLGPKLFHLAPPTENDSITGEEEFTMVRVEIDRDLTDPDQSQSVPDYP